MTSEKRQLLRYFRDLFNAGRFDRLENGVADFAVDPEMRRHFETLDRIDLVRAAYTPSGFSVMLYRENAAVNHAVW